MAELIKNLPSDQNERKRIKASIQEYVDAKVQMEAFKELMSGIVSTEKEDHGLDGPTFKAWAELAYDQQYNESKKSSKIIEASDKLDELDILFGGE